MPRYSVGHVFLAGDAAHIHPPIGGLGMNTGFQDAHNLSWKLGLVAQGIATDQLLESYSAERHPVGMDVVEQTSRAMDETIAGGSKGNAGQARESQLFINYRSSAWVQDDMAQGPAPMLDPPSFSSSSSFSIFDRGRLESVCTNKDA